MPESHLRLKNVLGFSIGPIGAGVFGLISIPIAAWVFLPEDIGRLNVFNIAISFILLFSVLGLDQAYVREFHEASEKPALFLNCFFPGYAVLMAASAASIFFARELAFFLYGIAEVHYWVLTMVAAHVAYFSRFLSLILRMQERGFAFSMSQILPRFLQLVMVLIMALVSWTKTFTHLLALTVIASAASLAVYSWNTREQWLKAMRQRVDRVYLNRLLKFGLPLLLSGLVYWALLATSTFALKTLSTLPELAVYSVATSFAGVAIVFQSIFSVIWAPTVYKWVAEGVDMTRVDSVAQQALALVCAIVVLTGALSWVVDWILPSHYWEVKYILMCCVIQPLLYTLSEVTCVGIGISRRTSLTIWVTIAALCMSVGLSIVLIPSYGASGAAISNAVAYLVYFVARTEASAFVWRQFPRGKLYFFVCLLVSSSVLIALLAPESNAYIVLFWLGIFFVVGWAFRVEYLNIFSKIRMAWKRRGS